MTRSRCLARGGGQRIGPDLASSDRTAVRLAANAIDQHLAVNAAVRGTAIPDNLRQLIVPPLRVLFAVSDADRIVQILDLARSRSDP